MNKRGHMNATRHGYQFKKGRFEGQATESIYNPLLLIGSDYVDLISNIPFCDHVQLKRLALAKTLVLGQVSGNE